MSQYNHFAKDLDTAFKEAREKYTAAYNAVEQARKTLQDAGTDAMKKQIATLQLQDAETNLRKEAVRIWAEFDANAADLRRALEKEVQTSNLADPSAIDNNALELMKTGILAVDDYVFPSQGCRLKLLEGSNLQQLADDIDCAIVVEYFKKVCWQWMKKNYSDYYWDEILRFDNPKQQNVTVNGVRFDYVQETKDHTIYVKIWGDIREGFPKEAFQKIEAATTAVRPFYENIYYLFSAGRACNYVEQLRNLDTVSVVDLKSLLGQKNTELFEIL